MELYFQQGTLARLEAGFRALSADVQGTPDICDLSSWTFQLAKPVPVEALDELLLKERGAEPIWRAEHEDHWEVMVLLRSEPRERGRIAVQPAAHPGYWIYESESLQACLGL